MAFIQVSVKSRHPCSSCNPVVCVFMQMTLRGSIILSLILKICTFHLSIVVSFKQIKIVNLNSLSRPKGTCTLSCHFSCVKGETQNQKISIQCLLSYPIIHGQDGDSESLRKVIKKRLFLMNYTFNLFKTRKMYHTHKRRTTRHTVFRSFLT